MSEKFQQLKATVVDIEMDIDKFYNKGNKSAGVRSRKALQKIKELAQDMRMDILAKQRK